jgi:hypothetical protein
MTTTLANGKTAQIMTVILRGVPKGFDWGLFSRQRCNLHVVPCVV